MQNKHNFFFSFLGIPTFREGGGGQAGWAKIPTFTENLFCMLPLTEHPILKSNWFWKPFVPRVICRRTHFKHVFHAEHENDDHDIDDIIMMLTHLLSILLSTSLNFSNSRLSSPLHTDMPSLTSYPNLSLKIKSNMNKIDFVIFALSPVYHLLELVHVSHVDLGVDRRVNGMFS